MKNIGLIFLAIVLVNCKPNTKSETGHSNKTALNIDLVDSKDQDQLKLIIVDLKPINQREAFNFSGRLRLKYIDGLYLIFDLDSQTLHCIDSTGNLKYSAGGHGRGPNEMNSAIDFTFFNSEFSFLIMAGNLSYISKYDTLNNMIMKTSVPYPISAFEQSSEDEYLLYTGWNNLVAPFRLLKWNNHTGVDSTFFYHENSSVKVGVRGILIGKAWRSFTFFRSPYTLPVPNRFKVKHNSFYYL